MDAWQAAQGIFTQLSLLSPATNVLGLAFAKSFAATEQLDAEEIEHAFFVVMMAGYATRTVFAETVGQPSIDPDALPISKPEDGTFDSEAIAGDGEAVRALADPVGALAFTEFGRVMTLPPDVWAGYVSMATLQLQANVASSTLPWKQFEKERIEGMLRYGYVLRCLDEVLGAEPVLREDSAHTPAAVRTLSSEQVSSLTDEELGGRLYSEASDAHIAVMGAEAEREVAGGPTFVLGLERWEALSEDGRDFAVVSSRLGLMIRLAELSLLLGASDHDSAVVISILEAVQDWMKRFNVDEHGVSELEQRSRIESAVIATAQSVTSTAEATEAILAVTPGTSALVRRNAFGRWLSLAEERGVLSAGLSREEHGQLMVFGYALAVVRELMIGVQAPDDQ
jgi:hypothetical protein